MTTPLADQPAFPFICDDVSKTQVVETGLTKREHFAALAMQGLLTSGVVLGPKEFSEGSRRHLRARVAVMEADALIAALEGKK